MDGKPHQVSAMLAVGADMAVNTPDQSVLAHRETFGDLTALLYCQGYARADFIESAPTGK